MPVQEIVKEKLYRDRPVNVLFTLSERKEMERIAEISGLSLSSFIRQAARVQIARFNQG